MHAKYMLLFTVDMFQIIIQLFTMNLKDTLTTFHQKLQNLEEEIKSRFSSENNRRNEIESIDKTLQTLSNKENLGKRKSQFSEASAKLENFAIEERSIRNSKDLRLVKELNNASLETARLEISLITEDNRKLKDLKFKCLKQKDFLTKKISASTGEAEDGMCDGDESLSMIDAAACQVEQCQVEQVNLEEKWSQIHTVRIRYGNGIFMN